MSLILKIIDITPDTINLKILKSCVHILQIHKGKSKSYENVIFKRIGEIILNR